MRRACLVLLALLTTPAAGLRAQSHPAPAPRAEREPAALPARADLRTAFDQFGLSLRRQGKRPTCSVFTLAGALEFAAARRQGRTPRLSVEFLNWAANQTRSKPRDGGFFSELWIGFATRGICAETQMTYAVTFDPAREPGPAALDEARASLDLGLKLHWIKRWDVKTGLTPEALAAIKQTLAAGWPVCGGFRWPKQERWADGVLQLCPAAEVFDGHSVLLVGFADDATQPGGGLLHFRNTGNGHDGAMPYAYARDYMNDAVWIE